MASWTQPTLEEAVSEDRSLREVYLTDQLEATTNTVEILQESLADLELAFEDRGWQLLSMNATREFSPEGLKRARELCRVMTVANPLLKRGLGLRKAYVWGQGVTISVRDQSDQGQDVNAVVQAFLDDNKKTFSGTQAHEEMEQAAFTDGDLFCALFTSRLTGKVQPRWLPVDEITDIIHDPEDQITDWYYKREWTERVVADGMLVQRLRTVFYPALGYEPQLKPPTINGHEVMWDVPVRMVSVNRPSGSTRGVPDSFAAIAWARSYKEFLEQWATLMRALARYAWQTKTRGDRAKSVAAKVGTAPAITNLRDAVRDGNIAGAGSHVVTDPNTSLEAIPKTGATIDADSGRPLAAMVATALGVPVTMLLGDPGVTGARATATTLDQPMELEMNLRRELWAEFMTDVLNHVIDWAIRAPQGLLQGTRTRDGDRIVAELPDNDDRTIDIDWPEFESLPVNVLVSAIAEASSWLPPLVVAQQMGAALKIDNLDEVLSDLTDEAGNFVDPVATASANAGQAAVNAFRKGQDPAAALNGGDPNQPPDQPPA